MNLISKDGHFCSDFEFNRFRDALHQEGNLEHISKIIQGDSEDVWFDLYRSITSSKEMAERQVEKQIAKQQRQQQRRLRRKKQRLTILKQSFMASELHIHKLLGQCKSREEKLYVRRQRAGSAPNHLNRQREANYQ